jgi:hypothetical protein
LHRAGLVVRQEDGRLTYATVAFTEETINGIELLRRSGIPLVTVSFGGLGEGVCSVDGEGCDVGECRRRVCQGPAEDDPYWQYFRWDGTDEWRWLTLGASATDVRDGDVDGWSWTGGDPALPAVTIDEVARLAGFDMASLNDPAAPFVARRTVVPPGAEIARGEPRQGWLTYAAGAGMVVLIGAGGLAARRRQRPVAGAGV